MTSTNNTQMTKWSLVASVRTTVLSVLSDESQKNIREKNDNYEFCQIVLERSDTETRIFQQLEKLIPLRVKFVRAHKDYFMRRICFDIFPGVLCEVHQWEEKIFHIEFEPLCVNRSDNPDYIRFYRDFSRFVC